MATKKDVLTFRVETTCTFQATLYKATDECKSDEQSLWQFPAEMIFEVPQHFKAIESGLLPPDADGYRALIEMGVDEETETLRAEFFKAFLDITRDGSKGEAQRHAEVAVLKENFLKFGQAKDPAEEAPAAPQGPSAEELLAQENEKLKAEIEALRAARNGKAVKPDANVAPAPTPQAPTPAPAPEGGN